MQAIQQTFKGNIPLLIQVDDLEDDLKVSLNNQQLRVSYDDVFLKYINRQNEMELVLS